MWKKILKNTLIKSQVNTPGEGKNIEASLEDMILKLEYPEINVMLVFNSISINVDIERDKILLGKFRGYLY